MISYFGDVSLHRRRLSRHFVVLEVRLKAEPCRGSQSTALSFVHVSDQTTGRGARLIRLHVNPSKQDMTNLSNCNMKLSILLLLILGFVVSVSASRPHYLHLTALVSDEKDDHAKFECWEMATPFASYPTVGDSISGLADVANVSYVVLPPKSKEGRHRPPHPMSVSHFIPIVGIRM